MRRPSATNAFFGAVLVGLAGGWALARRHDRSHRRDLFSSRPYRRFAALGWLATQADPETLPLLQDYAAWELVPALQRRAHGIIAMLESAA